MRENTMEERGRAGASKVSCWSSPAQFARTCLRMRAIQVIVRLCRNFRPDLWKLEHR